MLVEMTCTLPHIMFVVIGCQLAINGKEKMVARLLKARR